MIIKNNGKDGYAPYDGQKGGKYYNNKHKGGKGKGGKDAYPLSIQAVRMIVGDKVSSVMCRYGASCNRAASDCTYCHNQANSKFPFPQTWEDCEKIRTSNDGDGQA